MKADISGYELPKMPEAGKAIVYVVRPSFVGTLIKFGVFVDDKEVSSEMGYTKGVQYIYFNLLPGEHQILSKAENWASINVIAKAGDILFIQQEPKMGVLIARNELRVPQEYEGKYRVKHLTMGTIIKLDK
ncbi:MAG: DUF2846 domain-containing protein [bacterium]